MAASKSTAKTAVKVGVSATAEKAPAAKTAAKKAPAKTAAAKKAAAPTAAATKTVASKAVAKKAATTSTAAKTAAKAATKTAAAGPVAKKAAKVPTGRRPGRPAKNANNDGADFKDDDSGDTEVIPYLKTGRASGREKVFQSDCTSVVSVTVK